FIGTLADRVLLVRDDECSVVAPDEAVAALHEG
ncbi:MAG: hypothetical protein JWR66_3590, partial [Modestobacter sp.]|nr:hypothetical protein [Modestobacter sp.]